MLNKVTRSLSLVIVVGLLLYFGVTVAWAGTVSLTCTPPTQNTDGTALTDLTEIWAHWGTESGVYTQREAMGVDCAHELVLPSGTYYFAATAENSAGIESDYSNEVLKVIDSQPNPPTGLDVVTVETTAYKLSQTADKLVLVPVGTISVGVPCITSFEVNGKYGVPRDSVVWAGTQQPQVVVAECG